MSINRMDDGGVKKMKGNIGEQMAASYLAWHSSVAHFENVSDNPAYFQQDVDFLVTLIDGKQVKCEAKSDRHIAVTGNFCFETTRFNLTTPERAIHAGWSSWSKADYFFIWCPVNFSMYVVQTSAFRNGFLAYMQSVRTKARYSIVETNHGTLTANVYFPVSFVSHKVYVWSYDTWMPAS